MAVVIDGKTIIKSLWSSTAGKASTSSEEPPVLSNGQLLRLTVQQSLGSKITAFCFHPMDETRAAFGTSAGLLYGLSLRENKVFLLADTAGFGIRGVSFYGSKGDAFCYVVVATERNYLHVIQWSSGRAVQSLLCGAHSRPITSIFPVVTSTQVQYTLCISADSISLWSLRQISSQPGYVAGDKAGGNAVELPAFECLGFANPSQSGFPSQTQLDNVSNAMEDPARLLPQGAIDRDRIGSEKKPFCFLAVTCLFREGGPCFLALETNGVLSKWRLGDGGRRLRGASEQGGCGAFELERCIETLPFLSGCLAACTKFVVLGNRASATIALVDVETLSGLSTLDLQTEASVAMHPSSSPPPPAQKSGAAVGSRSSVDAVLQVAIVRESLILCMLLSRKVIGVSVPSSGASHHQLFAIAPPQSLDRHLGGSVAWRVVVPSCGLTIGAFWSEAELLYLHFPTTLEYWRRQQKLYGEFNVGAVGSNSLDAAPLEGFKVLPFLKERQDDRERSKTLDPELRNSKGIHGGSGGGVSIGRGPKVSPLDAFRFPRHSLAFDATHTHANWIDVNAIESRDVGGERSGVYNTPSQVAAREGQRVMTLLSRALYSDSMDDATCRYNVLKLHAYLNKYGVFPSKYRAAIWRFILGLPNKRVTAPQFASLARRPNHECVAIYLKPFGLPSGTLRSTLEGVLSVLAHHAPVFAIASFLPTMVYPLIRVCEADTQSIVEVLLCFFTNWGREFFVCFPQPPSMLGAFLTHQLQKRDPGLAGHLDQVGAGFETWGWDPMLSFFTDMLTGAEWLQVMDHAFMMEPMWLFMFHLCYLVRLREVLLSLHSAHEVLDELRRPHSNCFSIGAVIEDAYGMHNACPRNVSLMKPYFVFQGWGPSYEYPKDFICDVEVLEAKSGEIHHLAKREEEKAATQARLRQLQEEAEAAALREEMLLQQERAVIAAKYDSSADHRRSRVELERARQERAKKEQELRLFIVNSKLASAEQIESLEEEKQQAEVQLRHRFVDDLMAEQAWVLGEQLTSSELAQLEKTVEERMNVALQKLVGADYTDIPSVAIRAVVADSDAVEKTPDRITRPPLSASFSFPDAKRAGARNGPETPSPKEMPNAPTDYPAEASYRPIVINPIAKGNSLTTEMSGGLSISGSGGVDNISPFPGESTGTLGSVQKEVRLNASVRVCASQEEPPKNVVVGEVPLSRQSSHSTSRDTHASASRQTSQYRPSVIKSAGSEAKAPPVAASSSTKRQHLESFKPFNTWYESQSAYENVKSTEDTAESFYNPTQQRYLAMGCRAIGIGKGRGHAGGRGDWDPIEAQHLHHHSEHVESKNNNQPSQQRASCQTLYDNMPRSSQIQHHYPHLISPAVERMRAFYTTRTPDSRGYALPLSDAPTSSTTTTATASLPTTTTITATNPSTTSSLSHRPDPARVSSAGRVMPGRAKHPARASYTTSLTYLEPTESTDRTETEDARRVASNPAYSASDFSSKLDTASAASVIDRPHRDSYYYLPPQLQEAYKSH